MFPSALTEFLYHFHVDRDYFECHEILEEYWKKNTDQQKDSIWVGFIQLAVANYHHRRENFNGAKRTLEKAIYILSKHREELDVLGFEVKELFTLLEKHLSAVNDQLPYRSYILPVEINKEHLTCIYSKEEIANLVWGKESDLSNIDLIHRHRLRDRSEVIFERNQAINNRKKRD
jgi:uncharacterized protein